ncbi:long-chain-alcohol O-fatty-acyltransferase-like [Rutidosis leptorrhynchoides]|uniref:long-chain-alcohol O-fatty-acyltransferase-like n=1 Tax=Rutidosis leptorrhynchoides TaxID=125765 RepID=UPI003A996927
MENDDEELKVFIKVWLLAISAICYSFYISILTSKGVKRLLFLLPIITLFSIIPLALSRVHFIIITFIYLTWLANFKLVLFAFNNGPLASNPPLPLSTFISIALFPINLKRNSKISRPSYKLVLLALKAILLALTMSVYQQYKDKLHITLVLCLYLCYFYLILELGYAITAFFVKMLFLGFNYEIEPQFDEPYLSTSLQNFWGRRWNLVVSSILKSSVYYPVRKILFPILGHMWSKLLAIFITFLVSGLMHELLYFYLTRVWPTWEVTWLLVLHGVCVAVQEAVKMNFNGRFQLHWVMSSPLTMMFLFVTMELLLLPQLVRNGVDVKIINECSVFVNFFI